MSTKARMASHERREAIIAAAVNLFSQHGFRGTTTREIAAAVGVSEPVLYQHFSDKRDLYAAIIDQKSLEGEEKFGGLLCDSAQGSDDRAYFRSLATVIMRWHNENPAYVRLLFYSALEGHDMSKLCYERHAVKLHQQVADYIRKRIAEGGIREVDPLIAARTFVGMIAHFAQAGCIFRVHDELNKPDSEYVEAMIDIFLRGLANSEAK